jgi:hypothetical protein
MPHYRTRPMLVARGVQPVGADRRAPCRPLPEAKAKVNANADVNVNVDVDVDVNADDRETPQKQA